jgi:hypothetical protein
VSHVEPPPHDLSEALERRARGVRRARVAVLALVIGYFFLPYDWQTVIPVWLPFFAALALEAHFFVGGWLQTRQALGQQALDRGPQPRDLADFGGPYWRDPDVYWVEEKPPELVPAPAPVARHSTRRYVAEALAAIAVVAGILFYAARPHGWDAVSDANRARAEARFSHEAARIAGHPVSVACDTSGDHVGVVQEADGLAQVGGREAWVTPSICDTLYQLAFKGRVHSFPRTGRAIAVLAHESWHLHGVGNEGLANCYAFQSGVRLGVDLGLSRGRARAMMREQLGSNASDSAGNEAYLVPPGCHDGGPYDLRPGESGFP